MQRTDVNQGKFLDTWLYKVSKKFINENMKSEIRPIPIAVVPHKTSLFSQVMAVLQYKQITNYAPNSEYEKDEEARTHITLLRPHNCVLLFEAGELFIFAQFSFIFSSIRYLKSVIT